MTRARYELKYIAEQDQVVEFRKIISDNMGYDTHSKEGIYTVNSLYYDSDDYMAYFEKLDGVDKRHKIRLRFYGDVFSNDESKPPTVFLEAKHRFNNLIHKDRIKYPADQIPFSSNKSSDALKLNFPIDKQYRESAAVVQHLIHSTALQAQCWLSYIRQAYVCRLDPTLRITFDRNLYVHGSNIKKNHDRYDGKLFLPPHLCIVEIKFHWSMPLWILDACQSTGMKLRRYSKYCSALETLHPWLARRQVILAE